MTAKAECLTSFCGRQIFRLALVTATIGALFLLCVLFGFYFRTWTTISGSGCVWYRVRNGEPYYMRITVYGDHSQDGWTTEGPVCRARTRHGCWQKIEYSWYWHDERVSEAEWLRRLGQN